MGILLWIAFGLIVGAIARFVMPGPDPLGVVGTALLGMGGGLIGGLVGVFVGMGSTDPFEFGPLVFAVNFSLTLLFFYRCVALRAPGYRPPSI
jgi:uncharacterized membrane protein YeaQ/YmgE (transglycosylase-associated protein family)